MCSLKCFFISAPRGLIGARPGRATYVFDSDYVRTATSDGTLHAVTRGGASYL